MTFHPISARALFAASLLFGAPAAFAFPYDDSLSDLPAFITLSGIETRKDGTVATYNIPVNGYSSSINFTTIKGGDGGNAKTSPDVGQDFEADGGKGADVSAVFAIDPYANNALRPGGELRFVVGSKGEKRFTDDAACGGGGGGTAVLYRAPESGAEWVILAVAGGGGGAASRAFYPDDYSRDGKDAETGTSGGDGRSNSDSGGDNGQRGVGIESDSIISGGGGGYLVQSYTYYTGTGGGTDGGNGGFTSTRGADGGFGFGGGGAGHSRDGTLAHDPDGFGGGGGGYSGGGAGNNGGGGGGGSFLHSWASNGDIRVIASPFENGYIQYSLATTPNAPSLPGPTITIQGQNPVSIQSGGGYTDAGASAQDVYDNAVTASITGNNVNSSTPGTYFVTYSAVDQFGKTTTATRTVQVLENKPTFSIDGDVTVDEDSGPFSRLNFAYDINANDSGQTVSQFTVTNDNQSLFATQPAISSGGKLTFTPAANVSGSAMVTVVATDTGSDPEYTTSDPATFSITVTEVPDPPSFSIYGDIFTSKNSGSKTFSNFAYDFDANDSRQSLTGYVLTNDNNSLFSVQPAVDNAGKLTFTPASDTIGTATVTITGYDSGADNNSSQKTFTLTIEDVGPTAAFSVDKTRIFPGQSVQFTDASSDAVEWEWDFDNDGTIDSTEQNPSHTYPTAGTYSVKLNVRNTADENSVTQTDLVRVVGYGLANADCGSTDFANSSGNANSLGRGWYGKNADSGSVATPDWSTGLTTGTPGVLTQIRNSGTATRFGQFFANNLTGNNWALSVDLGGTGKFSQIRIWGGTLADNPSGTVLTGDDSAPASGLVDANGWTSVLYQGAVSASGTVTLNIDADLGQFDVLSIQFKSSSGGIGTTYDNFAFVQQTAPVAGDDSYETLSTETVTGNVLDNDSGSGAYNDSINVTAMAGEASNIGTEVILPSGALLTLASDGSFNYDPNGAFDTTTDDIFTYTVGNGASSTTATVIITVTVPDPLATFRTTYGLATDGSDDNLDWSNNGVQNIFYYLFGLGDPNEADIDRTLMPSLTTSGDNVVFSYRCPFTSEPLVAQATTSTDLVTWSRLDQLSGDEAPTDVSTEMEADGYVRYTITIPTHGSARFFSVRPASPTIQ